MSFYDSLREELLARRRQIRSFTLHPMIQGEYHEALIRDLVRKHVPERFEVGHGIIVDDKGEATKECDVIVYEIRETRPLLQSQDLVIADSKSVRFVMEVKSVLTTKTLADAIRNLQVVKKLESSIGCWIIGFETKLLLKSLYLKAWRSKVIQFVYAFQSLDRKTESQDFLNSQMQLFVETFRHHIRPGKIIYDGVMIYNDGRRTSWLSQMDDEQEVIGILSDIYKKGFWNLLKSRYNASTLP